jgi:hypothetical protein
MAAGHRTAIPTLVRCSIKLSDFVTEEEGRNRGDPTLLSEACDEGWAVLNEWWKKTDD